jgi:CRISPR-associated protein (TIGR03986 family)
MTVHAPFRFAPVHRWVYFPDWADLVTHDVPFRDGVSGELAIEIEARTPILVGGPRRKATDKKEGEIWPFRLPDGRYAIPGSSLQGLTRSILEIAAFGKLGPWIDKRRFGIRDLTEGAKPYYRQRLINHVEAGFLSEQGGKWFIRECKLRRIQFSRIPEKKNASSRWNRRSDAGDRYGWVKSTGPYSVSGLPNQTTLADGDGGAWIVVTGNTGVSGPKAKKSEFVFVETADRPLIPVSDDVHQDFLFIHESGRDDDKSKWNPTWRLYRERGYPRGAAAKPFPQGDIPVFFIREGGAVASIGLAFMFKLAHEKSTHDLLQNSDPAHVDPPKAAGGDRPEDERPARLKLDLPSVIFGSAADIETGLGLKRRACFDLAVAGLPEGGVVRRTSNPTVLLGPKPSYYPIYVRQPIGDGPNADRLPRGIPYATYTPIVSAEQYENVAALQDEHRSPELAGAKIWPARPEQQATTFPALRPAPPDTGSKVQLHLNALPAGTKFTTTLRFHNLRPAELGAVLWAMTFGEPAKLDGQWGELRHRIGMAKPYGLGQIAIRVVGGRIIGNNASAPAPKLRDLLAAFEAHMASVYAARAQSGAWLDTVQIKALKKAASPAANAAETLSYMELGGRDMQNTYVNERNQSRFLVRYAEGHEIARRGADPSAPRLASDMRGGQPGSRTAPGATARPVAPQPPPAREPALGDRVKAGDRIGTVIELPKDARSPMWHIEFGSGTKPQWFPRRLITILPP